MYLFRKALPTLFLSLVSILLPSSIYADCSCYQYLTNDGCSREMNVYSYEGDKFVFEINSLPCAFEEADPGSGVRLNMIFGDGTSEQREIRYTFVGASSTNPGTPQPIGKVYFVHQFPAGVSGNELNEMVANSKVNVVVIYAPPNTIPGIERISSPIDLDVGSLANIFNVVPNFNDIIDELYSNPESIVGSSPEISGIAGIEESERAVPAYWFPITISYFNPCSAPLNGSFRFEFDNNHMQFLSSESITPFEEVVTFQEGDDFFMVNFENLPQQTARHIIVYFDLNAEGLSDGDELNFRFFPISSSSCSAWDGDVESVVEVHESHDPNQILTPKYFSLYPDGYTNEDTLFFRVQFENVGRAEVTGVSIKFEMEEDVEFMCVKYMVLHEHILQYQPFITFIANLFPINLFYNPPAYSGVQTGVPYSTNLSNDPFIPLTYNALLEEEEEDGFVQPDRSNQKYYVLKESNQVVDIISKKGTLDRGNGGELIATQVVNGMVIPLSMKQNQGELMILARLVEDYQVAPSDSLRSDSLKVKAEVCFNIGPDRRTQCLALDHTVAIKQATSLPALGMVANESIGQKLYEYQFDGCKQMVPDWILAIVNLLFFVFLPLILFWKPLKKVFIPVFKKGS